MINIDQFLKFEEDNNLFELEIKEIKFWNTVRMMVFQKYINAATTNFYNQSKKSKPNKATILKSKALYFIKLIKLMKFSPCFISKNTEILIFNSPRRVNDNNIFICPYTDDFIHNINKKCAVIETTFNGMHYYNIPDTNIYYTDIFDFFIKRKIKKARNSFFSQSDIQIINNTADLLCREFGLSKENTKSVTAFIKNTIIEYYFTNIRYTKLLKRIMPKSIIEVCSYSNLNQAVNTAANNLSIPTIEVQHGIMSKYHAGYNYNSKMDIESFPSHILLYGQIWKDITRFPISDDKLHITGWPYFERRVEESKSNANKSEQKTVLFLSQPQYVNEMSKLAVSLADDESLKSFKFIYRFHPRGFDNWEKKFPWLVKSNVSVVNNIEEDIYSCFAVSDFQIGSNSTALIEGLAFELNTIILKFTGHEYMEELYNKGYASLCEDNHEKIKQYLLDNMDNKNKKDISYFWQNNSKENIINKINEITNNEYDRKA